MRLLPLWLASLVLCFAHVRGGQGSRSRHRRIAAHRLRAEARSQLQMGSRQDDPGHERRDDGHQAHFPGLARSSRSRSRLVGTLPRRREAGRAENRQGLSHRRRRRQRSARSRRRQHGRQDDRRNHRQHRRRAPHGAEPAADVQRRRQAAEGRRPHRLRLGEIPRNGRRHLAAAAADGQERRQRHGLPARVVGPARRQD